MTDISKTVEPKSDQLNADDLICGPKTIKITDVSLVSGDLPVAINYEGDNGKPWKPCKSMRRVLIRVWGKDGNAYKGRSVVIFCDPKVKFGGAEVGGIRISHVSHIKEEITIALTATRTSRKPYVVKPLAVKAEKNVDAAALKEAGDKVSKLGLVEFKSWAGKLSEDERSAVRQYSDGWKKAARDADENDEILV